MTEQLPRACKGMDVVVRDARGDYLQKRAISNIDPGHTFPVVFVAWRDDPDSEMAWPLEDVWPADDGPEPGLSHAEYNEKWGLAQVTPGGLEIPVPTRGEFIDNLKRATR